MNNIEPFLDMPGKLADLLNEFVTPDLDLNGYLKYCYQNHPWLFNILDLDLIISNDYIDTLKENIYFNSHFETRAQGGRGDNYRTAQMRYPLSRSYGIKMLFNLIVDKCVKYNIKMCMVIK